MIATPLLPYLLLAGVVAATTAGLGGYLKGRADGRALERANQSAEAELVDKVSQASQQAAARAIAGIQIKHTTIRQQAEKEIRENTIYRAAECRHPDGMLRHLNAALAGDIAPGGGELPAADAAAGPQFRRDHAEAPGSGEPVSPVPGGGAGGE